MLAFAVVGLVANIVGLLVLRGGAKESLNVKGAYLEVLGDLLGSVAVIVAAVVIATTGWLRADVVASVAVALMILPRTWTLLREAVDVLLEATPRGVDLVEVRRHILDTPGVLGAHDLHAWTITSGLPVLSVHVVVSDAGPRRRRRWAGPGCPGGVPGRPLRRRALHLPTRTHRPHRARVPRPRLNSAPPGCDGRSTTNPPRHGGAGPAGHPTPLDGSLPAFAYRRPPDRSTDREGAAVDDPARC